MLAENATFEKHYRIGDLARLWSLGRETVRKLVKDDPGVVKIRMASGDTSKPASRGHFKTGQLSASRTAIFLPYRH